MCFGFRDMYSAVVQSYDKSFSVQINLTLDLLRGLRRSAHYAHMLKRLFFYFFIIIFFLILFIYLTTILLQTVAWLVQFCRVTSSYDNVTTQKE